jgi:hypothetical protein
LGANGDGGDSAVARARGRGPAFYRRPMLAKTVCESTTTAWSWNGHREAVTRGWWGGDMVGAAGVRW